MAQIGLKSFLYAPLKDDGTYDAVAKLAGAIDFKETLDTNDAKLYSDDVLKDSDTSVSGGTIALGVDDDDDTVFCPLLGKTKVDLLVGEATVSTYESNTNDQSKHIGYGHIVRKNDGKFKVNFYPEVAFKPYSVDGKTKGEKLEYTTPNVEGTLYPSSAGHFKTEATVATETLAIATLYALFGKAAPTE